jgi:hypothetical protein
MARTRLDKNPFPALSLFWHVRIRFEPGFRWFAKRRASGPIGGVPLSFAKVRKSPAPAPTPISRRWT